MLFSGGARRSVARVDNIQQNCHCFVQIKAAPLPPMRERAGVFESGSDLRIIVTGVGDCTCKINRRVGRSVTFQGWENVLSSIYQAKFNDAAVCVTVDKEIVNLRRSRSQHISAGKAVRLHRSTRKRIQLCSAQGCLVHTGASLNLH